MKLTGVQLNKAILQTLDTHPKADPRQVTQHILRNSPPDTTVDPGEVGMQMERIAESWKFLNGLPRDHRPTPQMPAVNLGQSPMFMVHTKPALKSVVDASGWSTREALGEALTCALSYNRPGTVKRGIEGDVGVHPPVTRAHAVPLSELAGTHQSCAATFSDGVHTVEGTARQLIADPASVLKLPPVTVFMSTSPGDPNGRPKLWSMNNRRIKAMQLANRELAKTGRALPDVPIRWAGREDLEYALGPGKFNNTGHGEVQFTQSSDNQQRVMRHLASNFPSQTDEQIRALESAMKKGDEIDYAAMFDL